MKSDRETKIHIQKRIRKEQFSFFARSEPEKSESQKHSFLLLANKSR